MPINKRLNTSKQAVNENGSNGSNRPLSKNIRLVTNNKTCHNYRNTIYEKRRMDKIQ
jgi:hypothetical protein